MDSRVHNIDKVKHSGQVFTPDYLVGNILDCSEYSGQRILRRHVIDNSCGDGAFICVFVERYCRAFLSECTDKTILKQELEQYIHGIEIDGKAYQCCLQNLNSLAQTFGLDDVKWDILNEDALQVDAFDGKMDYVVGNPPYVRVHNLEGSYNKVKTYHFANGGMTDLYLVFFEIGLKMLRNGGCLCYITPSSWINSLAGANMREYINRTHCISELIDIGHFQPFEAMTYTMITKMVKGQRFDSIAYYTYDGEKHDKVFVENLNYSDLFVNGNIILGRTEAIRDYTEMIRNNCYSLVQVKNGFATLADKVFISDDFPFDDYVINVIKGSTGKWRKCFFPYDSKGKPLPKDVIFSKPKVAEYLNAHKKELLKKNTEAEKKDWYLYGRTQALKDVFVNKYSINTVIKDVDSIKINEVKKGCGVYSGLYILGNVDYDTICSIIKSQKFIDYISILKKYKSGGYYTFSSRDLEVYINYQLGTKLKSEKKQGHEGERVFEGNIQFF